MGVDRTVFTPAHRSGSACRGDAIPLLLHREGSPSPASLPSSPPTSWEALVEVQGILKGVSLQGAFSQRGVEPHVPPRHVPPGTAPCTDQSPPGGEPEPPPTALSTAHGSPESGPFPLSTPGSNTGTQVDGTPPRRGPWGLRAGEKGRPVSLPGRRGQHRPAPHPEGGQVHGCQSRQAGTKAAHGHLHVQMPLAGSASPAQPRPPSRSAHRGKRQRAVRLFLPVPREMLALTMCSGFSAPGRPPAGSL